MQNIKDIIESLLFAADEPLTIEKFKAVLETADTKTIRTALDRLADHYTARGGGFFLAEVAGGWQLRSRPEFNQYIKRMLQPSPQRLTKAALETLAIVAYNQPIIRADIEHIRGVDCGGVLRQLMERKMIRVLGRKEIPGRPMIYATTKLFLELFNLKSLKDLPSPKEMEELGTPDARPQTGADKSSAQAASSLEPPPSRMGDAQAEGTSAALNSPRQQLSNTSWRASRQPNGALSQTKDIPDPMRGSTHAVNHGKDRLPKPSKMNLAKPAALPDSKSVPD